MIKKTDYFSEERACDEARNRQHMLKCGFYYAVKVENRDNGNAAANLPLT